MPFNTCDFCGANAGASHCRCQTCGAGGGTRLQYARDGQILCRVCLIDGDLACAYCREAPGDIRIAQLSIRSSYCCSVCAYSGITSCYFCGSLRALHIWRNAGGLEASAVCGPCFARESCGVGNCDPTHLCERCRRRVRTRSRTPRRPFRPTGRSRRAEVTHEYDCECPTCSDAARGRFFFSYPVHFWPVEKKKASHVLPMKDRRDNRSSRAVSVEIEVSDCAKRGDGSPVANVVRRWRGGIVRDGSLGSNGFEINLAPAAGDFFTRQVDEVCAGLRSMRAWCDDRAGAHVHVDARDHSYDDIVKLVKLYAKVEDAMIRTQRFSRIFPNGRIGGSAGYTRPCAERLLKAVSAAKGSEALAIKDPVGSYRKDKREKLLTAVYGEAPSEPPRGERYNSARYAAANFHSYFYRGTVEFRIHAGTVKAKNIKAWASLCVALVDAAYKMTEKEVDSLVGTSSEVLLSVLPKQFHAYLYQRWDRFREEWRSKEN